MPENDLYGSARTSPLYDLTSPKTVSSETPFASVQLASGFLTLSGQLNYFALDEHDLKLISTLKDAFRAHLAAKPEPDPPKSSIESRQEFQERFAREHGVDQYIAREWRKMMEEDWGGKIVEHYLPMLESAAGQEEWLAYVLTLKNVWCRDKLEAQLQRIRDRKGVESNA